MEGIGRSIRIDRAERSWPISFIRVRGAIVFNRHLNTCWRDSSVTLHVSPVHAATRAYFGIDPYRLRSGAERAATRGGDRAAGFAARHRGRGQWQNTHTHLPAWGPA